MTLPAGIRWPVLLFSASFVFLAFALPVQTRALGASALAVGGLFSAFTATLLVLRPLVGWGLDRWGRRRFFLAAGVGYVLAMGCFAAADGLSGYYLARVVQGTAAALMWVAVRTMLTDLTEGQGARGQSMGGLNEASVRGSMLGAFWGFTLVGALGDRAAWPLVFAGYAALALVGVVVAWRAAPETRPAAVDGAAVPWSWQGLLAVPERLRVVLGLVLVTGFAGALIAPLYLVLLQDRHAVHWLVLAAAFFPAGVAYAVLQAPFGRLADRRDRRALLAAGLALSGLVCIGLPFLDGLLPVAVAYTLFAVGGCMAGPAEAALVGDLASADSRGRSFGWYEAATALGAVLGPLAGGLLYDRVDPAAPFVLNGALLLLAALMALWLLAPADRT